MKMIAQLYKVVPPLLFFSLITNLAILVSPIFMMQVLDRVIPSGNLSTLLLLGLIALAALATQALIEAARDISLGRVSRWIEAQGLRHALRARQDAPQEMVDDLAQASGFLSGPLVITALSLPWIPLFLLALFLIHPAFLVLILGLSAWVVVMRLAGLALGRADGQNISALHQKEQDMMRFARLQEDNIGIPIVAQNLYARVFDMVGARHGAAERLARLEAGQTALGALSRNMAQILSLSVGAYLVSQSLLSAGGMIAASILLAKVFGLIEAALVQWGAIISAFKVMARLKNAPVKTPDTHTEIPDFDGKISVHNLTVPRGHGAPPRLDRVSFDLEPGEALAIIGASGSGKSTLLHALAGITPAPIGSVFYDESEIKGVSDLTRFHHTGFLAQQAQLVPGTLAENITCFSESADDDRIVAAARIAGVHGLISALPNSYDTDIGAEPYLLSAGQTQRVSLARAIYQQPRYLFLDEPNALLDADGERALAQTLSKLKSQGTTIVMVLHRSGIMGLADKVLYLENGRIADYGNRIEVLGRINSGQRKIELPLLATSLQDLSDWVEQQFARHNDQAFSQKAQLVASELFNLARQHGPSDQARIAHVSFAFTKPDHCEISLIEQGNTQAPSDTRKIKRLLQYPHVDMLDLDDSDMALAIVAQLVDHIDIQTRKDAALYSVSMSSENLAETSFAKGLS